MWLGDDNDKALTRELKFEAIELGGSSILGADVRLELAPGTTVLVGRNGAGKSALLERIEEAFRSVVNTPSRSEYDPARITCEIVGEGRSVRYQCTWTTNSGVKSSFAPTPTVDESCRQVSPRPGLLWQVQDGRATRPDGTSLEIPVEETFLHWAIARGRVRRADSLVYPLYNIFGSRHTIMAGAPQSGRSRRDVIVPCDKEDFLRSAAFETTPRLASLLFSLNGCHEGAGAPFEEIQDIGRRIGILRELRLKIYRDPGPSTGDPRDFASVSLDGVNLGLLSDGTIRALELLVTLVDPENKILLLEEPESAVHPGLLSKLLHEIDAYSTDRQIILSTHSPQVVSWAKPDAIRLVERKDGVTSVRGLDDRTVQHLEKYLHDEDTLGEFVFGGGLDGFSE